MTGRKGNVHEFVPDKLGSASWGVNVGLAEDAAWDMASDREVWSAQRPAAVKRSGEGPQSG